MAVTVESFQVAFPEFAKSNPAMLAARLAHAEAIVSADGWGLKRDLVVQLTLADLLATSPMGRDAQLDANGQPMATTYRKQLWELMKGLRYANSTLFGTIDLTEADL